MTSTLKSLVESVRLVKAHSYLQVNPHTKSMVKTMSKPSGENRYPKTRAMETLNTGGTAKNMTHTTSSR